MKLIGRLTPLIIAFFVFAGCGERTADVAHGRQYAKGPIAFEYPGNWTIADEQVSQFPYYVVANSPGDAVAALLIFKSDEAMHLDDFVACYRDFLNLESGKGADAEAFTSEPPRLSETATVDGYDTVTERVNISARKTDVPYTRYYQRKKFDAFVCFVIEASPDEDLALVNPGFKQITGSLVIRTGKNDVPR